jgi:hypothetical protein
VGIEDPDPVELTLFTTAKPFVGHSAVIQRNAMRSWSLLEPRPEILLLGDEAGYAEAAAEVGAVQVPELERNEFGTPLLSGIFRSGHQHGRGKVLMFLNADIILPPAFSRAVTIAAERFPRFLLVGQRADLDIDERLAFDAAWYERLSQQVLAKANKRGDLCIDYFAFSRDLFSEVPPFAIGRTRYDNWLIWNAAEEGAVVVDASAFVRVVHQNHDYGHTGGLVRAWEGAEAKRAESLLGHWSHYHSISHARFMLDPRGEPRAARGMRYGLARPRRVVGHLFRATRPLRRRAKVLLASRRRLYGES